MYYAVSNLHGNKEKYELMLKLINFNEQKDILYVLGDTLDYGEGGIDILVDMSMRPNVYHIKGEHEILAQRMLSQFTEIAQSGEKPSAEFISEFRHWTTDLGGMPTLNAFQALDSDLREGLLEYFDEMTPYEEVTAGNKRFILCHAGIAGFKPGKDLDEYNDADFCSEPLDFKKEYLKNRTIVVGHVPTTGFNNGTIYQTSAAVNIDCGCAFDGKLGCLCLDTGREFYV